MFISTVVYVVPIVPSMLAVLIMNANRGENYQISQNTILLQHFTHNTRLLLFVTLLITLSTFKVQIMTSKNCQCHNLFKSGGKGATNSSFGKPLPLVAGHQMKFCCIF